MPAQLDGVPGLVEMTSTGRIGKLLERSNSPVELLASALVHVRRHQSSVAVGNPAEERSAQAFQERPALAYGVEATAAVEGLRGRVEVRRFRVRSHHSRGLQAAEALVD